MVIWLIDIYIRNCIIVYGSATFVYQYPTENKFLLVQILLVLIILILVAFEPRSRGFRSYG